MRQEVQKQEQDCIEWELVNNRIREIEELYEIHTHLYPVKNQMKVYREKNKQK